MPLRKRPTYTANETPAKNAISQTGQFVLKPGIFFCISFRISTGEKWRLLLPVVCLLQRAAFKIFCTLFQLSPAVIILAFPLL